MEAAHSTKGQQMKELKAVEILTNYIKNLNEMVVSLEEAPTVRTLEYEAEQALAELKELTQEKSCENCESWWRVEMGRELQNFGYCICKVSNIPRTDGITQSDFYCKHYTPKR